MKLTDLLAALDRPVVAGPVDRPICGVTHDSRTAQPGAVFVAIAGRVHDGHQFVHEAVARGAAAVVVERPVAVPPTVATVRVADTRRALALLSSAFFGHPSAALQVIGVTGTNGKGTTAALLQAMLARAGIGCGLIGTLGARIGEQVIALGHTTPEAPQLQQTLRAMADAGLSHVAMEVASHALALRRVDGVTFRVGVFTNLTQDHLDFHGTMDAYRLAKRRLFELLAPDGIAVLNADDPSAAAMAAATRARIVTYALRQPADERAEAVRLHLGGAEFVVRTPEGEEVASSPLRGRFNVYNALAAIATAQALGRSLAREILPALAEFPGVPGRFEAVDEGQPFAVIVDYAHTPDGLSNVLRTARDFARGRVIVVFGAGGDRDRTKRPVMGRLAAELADVAIVTSDNPRSEEPMAIIQEILAGTREGADGAARIEVEPDRRRAIIRALEVAQAGDVVVIAGKGHEPYQEINGVRHPFDDRQVAREALRHMRHPDPAPRAAHPAGGP